MAPYGKLSIYIFGNQKEPKNIYLFDFRTRTFSRTRTISTTSSPGLSGESRGETHRSRKDSTLSWTSTSDAILPTGDIIPVPEDTETDRPKRSLWQLISLNLVVLGIEFCYAMETALVIPLLLQMGLPNSLYSLTWLLSPTLGFFLSPVIGTLSDRCRCFWGRRRPFILVLCVGVIIGFTLFLNGRDLGLLAGDVTPGEHLNDWKCWLFTTSLFLDSGRKKFKFLMPAGWLTEIKLIHCTSQIVKRAQARTYRALFCRTLVDLLRWDKT